MAEETHDKPKLHIDSDWKAEAQAEKERLAKEAEAKRQAAPPRGLDAGPQQRGQEMPPADFQTLISTMISPALLYMGAIPDPATGQGIIHLDAARHHIDLLAVLEEKTKGNLSEEEAKLLTQALHELRLNYLQISKQVAEHLKKQAETGAKPGAGGPGPGGIIR